MPSFFISYSHVDKPFILKLTTILNEMNVDYFLDDKDINWGSIISDEINKSILSCKAIIVVISPASIRSNWVPYEIGLATGKGKMVLPILSHPSIELPPYLKDRLYLTSLEEVKTKLNSIMNFSISANSKLNKSSEAHLDSLESIYKKLPIDEDEFLNFISSMPEVNSCEFFSYSNADSYSDYLDYDYSKNRQDNMYILSINYDNENFSCNTIIRRIRLKLASDYPELMCCVDPKLKRGNDRNTFETIIIFID